MKELSIKHKLRVEWEKINLESQRALNYLNEKTKPVKSAHKILADNVSNYTRSIKHIIKTDKH